MKTVTLEVASRDEVTRRALGAFKGKRQRARISFSTPELLWKVLTAKRWEVLKVMAGRRTPNLPHLIDTLPRTRGDLERIQERPAPEVLLNSSSGSQD